MKTSFLSLSYQTWASRYFSFGSSVACAHSRTRFSTAASSHPAIAVGKSAALKPPQCPCSDTHCGDLSRAMAIIKGHANLSVLQKSGVVDAARGYVNQTSGTALSADPRGSTTYDRSRCHPHPR